MAESRTVKSRRNVVTGLLQYAVTILLAWVGRIIFVRVLSADYLGVNGLFSNVISVLSIADLGIPAAMTYSLYKPLAEGDKTKIASLINFFRKVYVAISFAVLFIGLSLIPILPFIVKLDSPIPNLTQYYVLTLINTVVSYLFIYRTTLLTADQKSYVLQKYVIIFKFITFIAQTVVLVLFREYLFYLIIGVLTSVIGNIVQNRAVINEYPYLNSKALPLEADEKNSIRKNVYDLFLYRISGTIQTNTDSILISLFCGTVFVGYYSNYQLLILTVTTVITVVFSNVKSSLGNLIASDDSSLEHKQDVYWTMESVNFWITAFCSICFICLFQSFIEISFSKEYLLPLGTVIVIVINFYTGNIRQPIWAFRETTGLFHETRFITMVTAILNIMFSVVMGYIWGMFGVLSATVIARMLYSWWKEPMILFNGYFGCSAGKYYRTYILRFLLFTAVCALTYVLCSFINHGNIYTEFILKMSVCIIIPNAVFFPIFTKDSRIKELLKRLLTRVK